jgi:hypothetical protein
MENINAHAPAISGVILPIRGDLLVFHRIGIGALTPAARRAAVRLAQVWPELPEPPHPPGVGGGVVRRPDGLLEVALPLQDLAPPDAADAADAAPPRTLRQIAGDLLLAEVVREEGGIWLPPPTFPMWAEWHFSRRDFAAVAAGGLPSLAAALAARGVDDAEATALADRFPTSVWQTLVAHWGVVITDETASAIPPHAVLGRLGAAAAIMRQPLADFHAVAALVARLAFYGLALRAAHGAA